MWKKLLLLILYFFASLSFQTGFAQNATANKINECNNLITENGKVVITKFTSLSASQLLDCASPAPAQSSVLGNMLSPLNLLNIIIRAIVILTSALAGLALVVAVIKMATSAGNKEKFEGGINLAKNAVIAIIICLTIYSFLTWILGQIGFNVKNSG